MNKFIFITNNQFNRECSKIEFDIPDDLNIWEFKTVCERMAASLGYSDKSIKKAFGEYEPISEEDKKFKELFLKHKILSGSLFDLYV